MARWLAAGLLVALSLATHATAQDAVSVVQEHRARDAGRKTVQHLAVLRNTSTRPVQNLRVTVELYDYFGKLLWARTVSPSPASLKAGETATLSVPTPDLPDYRQTKYRFQYRPR